MSDIREMINRGRLKRAIICAPAGLTWNWRRELKHFFDLDFKVLRGIDFAKGDPLTEPGAGLFIVSVDTAATDSVRERLTAPTLPRFDLAVFGEAHKLSWGDPNRPDSKTRRYRLAESLGLRATHLLLLTATPHMGKRFHEALSKELKDAGLPVVNGRALPFPGSGWQTEFHDELRQLVDTGNLQLALAKSQR
jgi:superfamily II DNA or RNA helicase